MGKQRPAERRAPACGHARGQRWCWSPPAVPRRPLPTSLRRQGWGRKSRAAGLVEGGLGDTHRKRHCSWSCDSKKHRMPSSPPDNCAAAVAAAAAWPTPGRDGEQSAGRGPSPSPRTCHDVAPADHPARASPMAGSLLHAPQVVFKMPAALSEHVLLSSSSNGTSSRKSLPLQPGSDAPLAAHPASAGFPHHSSDFLESPPSNRV